MDGEPLETEMPVVWIRPTKRWSDLDLGEVWRHRDLLLLLVTRDIKLRYRQTYFGVLWAVIQPLVPMLLFSLVFGGFIGVPSDGVRYPVFVYSGLLLWSYFSQALGNSANSLVGSSHMLSKVYFPRLVLPCAPVLSGLVDFAVAAVLLVALMAFYGVGLSWRLLLVPAVMALTALLALATGTLLAAVNVVYRDVRHAIPLGIQAWMFATPIIYPVSVVPSRWRWLFALNPLSGLVGTFRALLFATEVDLPALIASVVVTFALAAAACLVFVRMERHLADFV